MDDIPAFGSFNAQSAAADLTSKVSQIAPMATVYTSASNQLGIGVPIQYTAPAFRSTGAIDSLGHFLGGVASTIGHVGVSVAGWLAKAGETAATSSIRYGQGLAHGFLDNQELNSINSQNDQTSAQIDQLGKLYASGRISQSDYLDNLKEMNQDMNNLIKQSASVNGRIKVDQADAYKATVDTASLLVAFLGTGFGASGTTAMITRDGLQVGVDTIPAQTAAQYLKSTAADMILGKTDSVITQVAGDAKLLARLPEAAQTYIQRSVGDVVMSGAEMSGTQIVRAAGVNMAIKYPIYFSMLSSTGSQIYTELDNKKYGDAVRTAAFNAALLLSGGAIGWSVKELKYGAGAIKGAVFQKTGYWDELSKYFAGTDTPTADMTQTMSEILSSERDPMGRFWGQDGKAQLVQQLSDHAATAVHATGGDEVAAAQRVALAEKARYNQDLTKVSMKDWIMDTVKQSGVKQEMDTYSKARGLAPMVPVRVDQRQLPEIAKSIFSGDKSLWAGNLQTAIEQNQGYAWAHNQSFINQVKDIIKSTGESEGDTGADAVKSIKASTGASGIPKNLLDKWSAQGYLPAVVHNLEDPFVKGEGKIATKFFDTDDFFTKMVQPLPVARSLGNVLVKMGLSPDASTQRVYQMLNANLATNLRDLSATDRLLTLSGNKNFSDDQQAADWLQKKLSSYIKAPTRGRIVSKMPISDMRLMTTGDIKAATGATDVEAGAIQKAIVKANLDMPMAIRGMGDRMVDKAFQFAPSGAVMRRYLRLQGALRFSWNPFFQYLRVIPKTEYLSEAHGGGVFRSFFAGRLKEVAQAREDMRDIGAFGKTTGFSLSAEATDAIGTSPNITRQLLPMQERSMAGVVDAQAQRMGMGTRDYIRTYPDQVKDVVQGIAEYPKDGNFINSPLARTLNIAFFPFRFESKVAAATAKGLANTSLMTQTAVIKGLMGAHQYLNSPEGQAWYSQNADAIGIFKYISPLASLNEVFQSFLPGHDHSLGNFGEVGGLPFGWIPALLDAEGLTHFNQPGANPQTGQPYPSYIPQTVKGQAAIAVQDLLGAVFSYPGAEVGLPSKGSLTRDAALDITGASKTTDLKSTTPDLSTMSPQAQAYARVVGKQQPQAGLDNIPQFDSSTTSVPAQPSTANQVVPRSVGSGTTKKKKADFTPALLPGQTTLGQL